MRQRAIRVQDRLGSIASIGDRATYVRSTQHSGLL